MAKYLHKQRRRNEVDGNDQYGVVIQRHKTYEGAMMKKLGLLALCVVACVQMTSCFVDSVCTDGDTVCYEGYTNTCSDGRWLVGTVCNTAAACWDGERVCSYDGVPNACAGGIWFEDGLCRSDEVCTRGYCACQNGARMCDAAGMPWLCVNGAWASQPPCGSNEFCDAASGTCLCRTDVPAFCSPNNEVTSCVNDANGIPQYVVDRCASDEYCDAGQCWCAQENKGICDDNGKPWICKNKQWVEQSACGANEVCDNGQCKCQGTATACSDDTSFSLACNDGRWQKIQCADNELCVSGACVCKNDARRCNGNGVPELCVDHQWVAQTACANDQLCVNGDCVCRPNSVKCGEDPAYLYVCSNDFKFAKSGACTDEKSCVDGKCVCSNEQKRCSEGFTQVCENGDWKSGVKCESSGLVCSNGACVCPETTTKCEQNKVYTCTDGAWNDGVACGAGESCEAGACKCIEGEKRCDDQGVPRLCDNGTWVSQTACTDGKVCHDGICNTTSCFNGRLDEGENAIDCGPNCANQCVSCKEDKDCATGEFCDIAAGFLCQKRCTDAANCNGGLLGDGNICRDDGRCASESFEFVVTIPEDGAMLTIPMQGATTTACDFDVKWGDDSQSEKIADCANAKHTYEKQGDYTVSIKGKIEGFGYENGNEIDDNAPHIKQIKRLGNVVLGKYALKHLELDNTVAMGIPNPKTLTTMTGMFYGAKLTHQLLWDTSNVTAMDHAFEKATLSADETLAQLNYKKVTSFTDMLKDVTGLDKQKYCDFIKLEIIKAHIAQLGMTIDCTEPPTVPAT